MKYILKKVFDKDGDLTIRFGWQDSTGVKEWLRDTPTVDIIKYGKIIDDCPVFGMAVEFPCKMIECDISYP